MLNSTGWMTVIAWQALDASSAFLSGTLIQAILVLKYPDYDFKNWRGTLMVWAVLCFSLFVNTIARNLLPRLEGLILLVHVLGFFGVLIPLVVIGNHQDNSTVWTSFNNDGGWPTQGMSAVHY